MRIRPCGAYLCASAAVSINYSEMVAIESFFWKVTAMIKKLNGWQRLWVVVSGLYLCLVAVYVTLTLPTPEKTPHSQIFYDQLRPELKKNIVTTSAIEHGPWEDYQSQSAVPGWIPDAAPAKKSDGWNVVSETPATKENAQKLKEASDKATPLNLSAYSDDELRQMLGIQSVGMPNGHVLNFSSILSEKDKTEVTQDYWRSVEKAASQKRLHYIFIALLFWAGPVIILYVLGWSVGWVHRGFKK